MTDPYELWKSLGRPGGDFGAWQASQGGQGSPDVTGGSVAAPVATPAAPTSLEQMIRQGAQGQSEDFARFNSGTVQGWGNQYYDAAASAAAGRPQFRSMRGQSGYFDKPTECPPGMGPSGPNETDPCTSTGYGGAQPAAVAAPAAAVSPLQPVMTSLQGQVAAPTPASPVAAPMTPYMESGGYTGLGGVAQPASSLQSLIAPLNKATTGATLGTQGGLTNMLKSQQKRPGQWF
jgi:hypothetical protein